MYALGEGVAEDIPRAYLWLNLATAVSAPDSEWLLDLRNSMSELLTPAERVAVQELAARCQASKFKDCGEPKN